MFNISTGYDIKYNLNRHFGYILITILHYWTMKLFSTRRTFFSFFFFDWRVDELHQEDQAEGSNMALTVPDLNVIKNLWIGLRAVHAGRAKHLRTRSFLKGKMGENPAKMATKSLL